MHVVCKHTTLSAFNKDTSIEGVGGPVGGGTQVTTLQTPFEYCITQNFVIGPHVAVKHSQKSRVYLDNNKLS